MVVLSLFFIFKSLGSSYKRSWVFGIFLNVFLCLSGMALSLNKQAKTLSINNNVESGVIVANIIEPVSEKPNSVKAVINIAAIKSNKNWYATSGKAIVYFEKDSLSKQLEMGDKIIFEPKLNDIKNTNNPYEFNYKRYLFFHLITKQAYLKSNSWRLLKKEKGNLLQYYANKIRNKLLRIYEENGIAGDELSIASALTLGYKDKLDEEIKRSYSSAGAMHVLAVSGLHVGIIYLVFNAIFFFFEKNKTGRIIKTILLLLILWSYACITGLSPSVMRASTMFSFIIIAKTYNRKTNIYNTLAASAFFLILINPFIITEVGFQLSYMAVLSIVFFQPKMYKWISFKYKFLDKAWALFTVSVAAQLGTAPIGMYYFHQFPNYFFITNFIVIPAATIILCTGIFVLATSFIPVVSSFVAEILSYIIKGLNYSVSFIEQMPYSTTNDISINLMESIIIYLIIILISFFFLYKNVRLLQSGLLMITILLILIIYDNFYSLNRHSFIVYNIRGNTAFNFIDGNDNILYSDIEYKENPNKLMYSVKNNWLKLGVKNEKIINLKKLNKQFLFTNLLILDNRRVFNKHLFFSFYDKRILLLKDDRYLNKSGKTKFPVDFIILSGNIKTGISQIIKLFDFKKLIIDSSNSTWTTNKLIRECKEKNIEFIDISNNGAFVYEF